MWIGNKPKYQPHTPHKLCTKNLTLSTSFSRRPPPPFVKMKGVEVRKGLHQPLKGVVPTSGHHPSSGDAAMAPRPRLEALQALRYLAEIQIVGFHFYSTTTSPAVNNFNRWGNTGLTVFFVLSGSIPYASCLVHLLGRRGDTGLKLAAWYHPLSLQASCWDTSTASEQLVSATGTSSSSVGPVSTPCTCSRS